MLPISPNGIQHRPRKARHRLRRWTKPSAGLAIWSDTAPRALTATARPPRGQASVAGYTIVRCVGSHGPTHAVRPSSRVALALAAMSGQMPYHGTLRCHGFIPVALKPWCGAGTRCTCLTSCSFTEAVCSATYVGPAQLAYRQPICRHHAD